MSTVTNVMRNKLLSVSTRQGFREFLAAYHDGYRAARSGALGGVERSHGETVKRLDKLIGLWQARTALPWPKAQRGLHHWDAFRAAQAYVAEFVSLWEKKEYEELARRLDSAFFQLGFEFSRKPGKQAWHASRSYSVGIFHGDAIIIECLLELHIELGKCLPRVSLALDRDQLARWVRAKRRLAGVSARRPPPAPTPGPRDAEKFQRALGLLRRGQKPASVGRAVGVSLATIYRWRKSLRRTTR